MKHPHKTSEYFLYLSALLFAALFPLTKIADFDLFIHLRMGADLFEGGLAFKGEAGWFFRPEWLSQAIIYLSYRLGGFYGLGSLKSLLFVSLCLITFATLRIFSNGKDASGHGSPLPHVLTLLVLAYALRFRLDLRPYYFSYIFIALYVYAFLKHKSSGSVRTLYFLPLMQVLWGNTHSGWIAGPALLLIMTLSEAVRTRKIPRALLISLPVVFALSGLNPEGFGPYEKLIGLSSISGMSGLAATGQAAPTLGEWQALSTELLWGYGLRYTLGFQVLVAGTLVYLLREAVARRFNLFATAVFAGSIFYTTRHMRFAAIASILLAPYFYAALENVFSLLARPAQRITQRAPNAKAALNALLAATLALLFIFTVLKSNYYSFGFGPKQWTFPEQAIEFLDENSISGNAFNTVTVGSYMLWATPERVPLIDARIADSALFSKYEKAIAGANGFALLDAQYNFNYALIDYNVKSRWRYPLHLNTNPSWALVHWDRASALYLKKSPQNALIIEKHAYKVLRPFFNDFSYLDPHTRPGADKAAVLDMIKSDVKRNPDLHEVHLAAAYHAYYLGLKDLAFSEVEAATHLKPGIPLAHISMAMLLLEQGDRAKAIKHLQQALRLNPRSIDARKLLGRAEQK